MKLASAFWPPPELRLPLHCGHAQSSDGRFVREVGAKCNNKSGESSDLISGQPRRGAAIWIDQQVCRDSTRPEIKLGSQASGSKSRLESEGCWTGRRHSCGVIRVGARVKASALKQFPRARRGRPLLLAVFTAARISERDDLGLGQLNSLIYLTTFLEGGLHSRLWH